MMIIVVDDNDDNRELAAFQLQHAGFDVVCFESGEPALEYLNRGDGNIEAVILDLSLPTLDGLTIAEQIRLNEVTFQRQPVPLAFYTAHSQSSGGATERIAAKCNVERIWHKPADTPYLDQQIKDWLISRQNNNSKEEVSNHAV